MRWVPPERKGYAVDLDHKASEDLAKMAVWSEESLRYARERCQRKLAKLGKLAWLLRPVKMDLEGTLHATG